MSSTSCSGFFTVTPNSTNNGFVPSGTTLHLANTNLFRCVYYWRSIANKSSMQIFLVPLLTKVQFYFVCSLCGDFLPECLSGSYIYIYSKCLSKTRFAKRCRACGFVRNGTFTISPTTTGQSNVAPTGTTYTWGVPTSQISIAGQSATWQTFIFRNTYNPTSNT
jgi:hypothetical protein